MMAESTSRDRLRAGPFWGGLTLAAAVSIAAISFAADPARRAAGIAPLPFGWYRLIVVHTVANLFFSWYLARMLAQWRPVLAAPWKAVVWGVAGLAVAGMTVLAGGAVETLFTSFGRGGSVRLVERILWCTLLQVPWCMAALAAAGSAADSRRDAIPAGHLLAIAVMTTVGVPASYLAVFLEQETVRAHDLWRQGAVVQAERLVQRLCDVGSHKSLGTRPAGDGSTTGTQRDVTPSLALADLRRVIGLVNKQVDELTAAAPSEDNRLQLAQAYLALDRPEDAAATLTPLADQSPRAALILSQIDRQQGRFDAARQRAAAVVALTGRPTASAAEQQIALQAYDLLAVLAGEQGHYAVAERHLLEALDRLPLQRAAIHYRLGKHYEIAGDFPRALDHLRKAAEADPQHYSPPEGLLAKMLSTGAPVGLARPKSSRYR